jgi:hypothetical protein
MDSRRLAGVPPAMLAASWRIRRSPPDMGSWAVIAASQSIQAIGVVPSLMLVPACTKAAKSWRRRLRSPAPGQAAYLTNQVINALAAPVEAAWRELDDADQAAAAIPARVPLGELAPDMARLEAETKQITHAIRMAAYNAETVLARALDGHYARAGDEAYALIREALTASGDICPGNGQLLVRLDPLTAPRRTQALAALCDQLTHAESRYPGTDLILRYEVKSRPNPA